VAYFSLLGAVVLVCLAIVSLARAQIREADH
jgi:hypothetical protein